MRITNSTSVTFNEQYRLFSEAMARVNDSLLNSIFRSNNPQAVNILREYRALANSYARFKKDLPFDENIFGQIQALANLATQTLKSLKPLIDEEQAAKNEFEAKFNAMADHLKAMRDEIQRLLEIEAETRSSASRSPSRSPARSTSDSGSTPPRASAGDGGSDHDGAAGAGDDGSDHDGAAGAGAASGAGNDVAEEQQQQQRTADNSEHDGTSGADDDATHQQEQERQKEEQQQREANLRQIELAAVAAENQEDNNYAEKMDRAIKRHGNNLELTGDQKDYLCRKAALADDNNPGCLSPIRWYTNNRREIEKVEALLSALNNKSESQLQVAAAINTGIAPKCLSEHFTTGISKFTPKSRA